ncbi:EpsG family protein [Comamonas sp. Y33R10-2]|uniref:EpsG family protein n=1 Tax=Comamonas sp. Y33R10-2 TaxID=2853257 RepID=UPI001C5CB163|nr:EpsG family protein [Comamonas sp. Y33R10-2]QXZ09310.1 EpsG family protein [Comamonas sp. Y33R10-2]
MHYLIINISLLFFSFIRYNKAIGFIIFLLLVYYLCLMYPGSNDFVGYFANYDCLINEICNDDNVKFEKGYELIVMATGWGGYQFLLFSVGLINIFSIYFFTRKFERRSFFFLAFMGVLAWTMYTEALRQSLAFSLLIIGVSFLIEGSIKKYVVFVFLASFFHISAIVSIIVLINILGKKFLKILVSILLLSVFLFAYNPVNFIEIIIAFLPKESIGYEKLLFYITSDIYKPVFSFGIGAFPDVLLIGYLLLNLKQARLEYRYFWIYGGILLFVIFSIFAGKFMPVFTRLGWYGLPFLAIFMYSSIWRSKLMPNFSMKYRNINILLIYLWIFSQMLRPFVYDHSNFNIFKQELFLQRIDFVDDAGMRSAAEQKCKDLISLGYDELCYLQ